MDTTPLKKYAPQARREFKDAVTARAARFGLRPEGAEPVTVEGDVTVIGGQAYPKEVAGQRAKLEAWIERAGFEQVMEAAAYTWFNRFVAIRYMEVHGYLDHGYRVLSHPTATGDTAPPEILEQAQHVELPGLDRQRVIELKLDGGREEELYRLLLIAQCNALHRAMPFLFERVQDETELLLPDNLLHSGSLIRRLVSEIPEEHWQQVEVLGWLYQFYISEKKDEVIGRVVRSEDIPAATQLFTPNWIVKYLVQNSIGRQWLATYPHSPLKQKMEYYIEPAEQTAEVQAQLDQITPGALDPERMMLLDPACGSGHILVEAYYLFKAIYTERGYRARDIPRLILHNNLYGLEIDERSTQLAAFALLMKARADDRRLLEGGVRLNVYCIRSSEGLDAEAVYEALTEGNGGAVATVAGSRQQASAVTGEPGNTSFLTEECRERATVATEAEELPGAGFTVEDVRVLLSLFDGEKARTFGSLIRIPEGLAPKLAEMVERADRAVHDGDVYRQRVAEQFLPIAEQGQVLGRQFDAVVANPPYMGNNGMNSSLKALARSTYPSSKNDLFAMFIERGFQLARAGGYNAMITMHAWMFLTAFAKLRAQILRNATIVTVAHLGAGAFSAISGHVVSTAATVWLNRYISHACPVFARLTDGGEETKREALKCRNFRFDSIRQDAFASVPNQPLAYWLPEEAIALFENRTLSKVAESGGRTKTHDDEKYVRYHWEVSRSTIGVDRKWRMYEKGGRTRKYYGNKMFIVDWSESARFFYSQHGGLSNPKYWSREGLCWSDISGGVGGFRVKDTDTEYGSKSPTLMFSSGKCDRFVLAYLNSPVAHLLLGAINPTFQINVGDVLKLPAIEIDSNAHSQVITNTSRAIAISEMDWNLREEAWNFQCPPLLQNTHHTSTIAALFESCASAAQARWSELKELERENNEAFITAAGLGAALTATVDDGSVTLNAFGRDEEVGSLLSYAIGCMMGRYTLDEPGIIYAHSGNEGFDPSQYQTFPADSDGIIPIIDLDWFDNDAAHRVVEFIATAWPTEHLEENLDFIADSLKRKRGETARETIRRYLSQQFFKDHLQTYKRRPIYWLFTSGRQRAFQALVYLHRYNAATLSRMRTEYVIPLQGRMASRITRLQDEAAAATATSHRRRAEKERELLLKQQEELLRFDEKLKHYADRRIELDLDDGVKVNYGKFGDLLAEVKAVTGTNPE